MLETVSRLVDHVARQRGHKRVEDGPPLVRHTPRHLAEHPVHQQHVAAVRRPPTDARRRGLAQPVVEVPSKLFLDDCEVGVELGLDEVRLTLQATRQLRLGGFHLGQLPLQLLVAW